MSVTLHLKSAVFYSSLCFFGACDSVQKPNQQQNAHKFSRKLNDTGIIWSGNYPKGIRESCTAEMPSDNEIVDSDIIAQQDCSFGRDAFVASDKDGAVGFVFRKIGAEGKKLANDAKHWRCVKDEISGLMWEVKLASIGLHDSESLFTWYSSNDKSNGGDIGDWNSRGSHCYGYLAGKPKTYCHVEQFVSRVNKKGLCGFNNWRLPSRSELTNLVNFGETEPAIDTVYFPGTKSDFYWSSSPVVGRVQEAWTISFQFGYTTPMRRTDTRYARLVRTANE